MKPKVKLGILTAVILISLVFIYGVSLAHNLREKLGNISMAPAVYDRHGRLIGDLFNFHKIQVPLKKISPMLQNAVIAIEDARYFRHHGIDPRGITRALFHNLIPGGAVEGGSTITQQLAKTVLLSSERTILRKLQDITCAFVMELIYGKEEILEMYLNNIYLAHGNIGVEAASRYYFGKSASKLTLEESALLAGIIRSPENYSPLKHPDRAEARRNLVLRKMLEQGYISEAEYKEAAGSKLKVVPGQESATVGAAFLDYVGEYLTGSAGFSADELRYGGYRIYTTLDLAMQKEAERILSTLPRYSAQVQPQAALVTLDPATGQILAMVGSRNYAESQLNRAVNSLRQPGSAIKPFLYATALEKGYTAASIFEDKPVTITLENGTEWQPENYDQEFRGRITLRQALRESVNTVAVQLLQAVGVEEAAAQIERMGVTTLVKKGKVNDLNPAPLALGGLTRGVSLLELTAAYAPFANQGNYRPPSAVVKVTDRHGKTIREFTPGKSEAVLSPQTAYIMTMLMKDVVENGTGRQAGLPDRPVAGKTGTTSNYTNAWFIGYTPDLLTAVWMGNDRQEEPMVYKEGKISGSTAAGVWRAYMQKVTAGRPVLNFPEPPGIIWANVDPNTGKTVPAWLNKNSYPEVFAEDNVPRGTIHKIWHGLFHWLQPKESQTEQSSDNERTKIDG